MASMLITDEAVEAAFEDLRLDRTNPRNTKTVCFFLHLAVLPASNLILEFLGTQRLPLPRHKHVRQTFEHHLIRLQLRNILYYFMPPFDRNTISQVALVDWVQACVVGRHIHDPLWEDK